MSLGYHPLIKHQSCHHIETDQLIYRANQLGGFYRITTWRLMS